MVQFLEGRNRAWAQLNAPINGSDTNVALVAWQGSRLSDVTTASGRKVRAQIYERDAETGAITKCELVNITNNVSDVLIIERAVEGTRATDTTNTYAATPQSFTANAIIEEVISSEVLYEIQDEVNRLETDKLDKSVYDAERVVYAASSAWDDDYEILTGDSLATVADGRIFSVRADVANTGAATLKVDATSPIALKKISWWAFADLATGDIIANQIFFAMKNSAASCYQFSLDPATLSLTVPDADETTKGISERATNAESIAMTDTERFINAYQLWLFAGPLSLINPKTHKYDRIFPAIWPTADAVSNGWLENSAIAAANQWGGGIIALDTSGSADGYIITELPWYGSQAYLRFADIGTTPIYIGTRVKFGISPSATEALSFGIWDQADSLTNQYNSTTDSTIRFCLDDNTGDKLYSVTSNGANNRNNNISGALTLTNWLNLVMVISSTQVLFYAWNDGNTPWSPQTHTVASDYLPTTTNTVKIGWGIQDNGSQPDMHITPIHIWLPYSS